MADKDKEEQDEGTEKTEKTEKKGVLSSFMRKKKTPEAEVDGTENMREELVTSKMVEPKTEELVKAGEEIPTPRPKSKSISKDADAEKPVHRKSDRYHLANRSGGAKKYFGR